MRSYVETAYLYRKTRTSAPVWILTPECGHKVRRRYWPGKPCPRWVQCKECMAEWKKKRQSGENAGQNRPSR